MSETSQEETIILKNGRILFPTIDLPIENTEAKTEDGIPYGNLNLHEPPKGRTVLNSAETVQPSTVVIDNSVETGQTGGKKKL